MLSQQQQRLEPQDLLAMNAELARMAKELRAEMTAMYRGQWGEGVPFLTDEIAASEMWNS